MTMLDHLQPLDRALVAAKFPPLSPFWMGALTKFYTEGRRQLTARVGRRGGKSSSICRIAVAEALYGEHAIPPGDVGVVAIVSVSRDQAMERLRTIGAILRALKVPHEQVADEITLKGKPVVFKVFSCSVRGVIGFTAICVICDEVARWRAHDSDANPAPEVLASLRPTMVTMPNAKLFLISSPSGEDSLHEREFKKGDEGTRMAVHGETWIANPTLTEQACRDLASDEREFQREYAAVPQEGFTSGFFAEALVGECTDKYRTARPTRPTGYHAHFVAVDPAFSVDGFGICIAHVEQRERGPIVVIDYVHSLRGPNGAGMLSPNYCVGHTRDARLAFPGSRAVYSDQFSAAALTELFMSHGLYLVTEPWSAQAKWERFSLVRQLLADGKISLPDDPALRREFQRVGVRMSPSGNELIESSGRDDMVSALVHAVWHAHRQSAAFITGPQSTAVQPMAFGSRRMDDHTPAPSTVEAQIEASYRADRAQVVSNSPRRW